MKRKICKSGCYVFYKERLNNNKESFTGDPYVPRFQTIRLVK